MIGRMNGYEKRAQKKREDILDAAQKLFLSNGISAVTIEQIADMAHVSRVTLFKYFKDKENLVRETVLIWTNTLLQEFDRIAESSQPFHKKILDILHMQVSGIQPPADESIVITVRGNAELMSAIKEQVVTLGLPRIMSLIESGKREGAIDHTLDNGAILTYFAMFSAVISDPAYIKRNTAYQKSMFDLFMAALIVDWRKMKDK